MSDLVNHRSHREALRASGERTTGTRYGEAVNRYLGAVGYRPHESARHVPAPAPAGPTDGLVVVGADDTPTSYIAVDHAAIEAELRGWGLRIVHALPPADHRRTGPAGGNRLLERLTERVHAHSPSVTVTSRLMVGSASPLLLADAAAADLVVVGHRHRPAGTAFGLSVGDRVAAGRRGTVLVVRVPGWPPGQEFGARPIVVGVDHAPSPAVAFAMEEARVRGCDLVMVHAGTERTQERHDLVSGVHIYHRDVPDDPITALIDASGTAAAVVVGRTGMIGVPASLGSIGRAMVERAYCPVFLVG